MKREMLFAILGILLFGGLVAFVAGTANYPNPARTLTVVNTERVDNYTVITETAEAGNITTMNITGWTQTMTWAGFVGNVTGRIVLDDFDNNSLYDWRIAEPQGEVYASNDTVDWAKIKCFNFTANGSVEINLTLYESDLGLQPTDYDGVDETFNATDHPTFWAGTTTLTGCPTTNLYQNDAPQNTYWWEVLLTDETNVVYAAIIEDDTANSRGNVIGFDGKYYDYQIIVGENGHNGDDYKWEYYFYVELE
ncbi:hypothetical protein DRJ48_05310 [Candidatus Woesearchaeota archaeon]|nr:MAG: hypothetical protein DRJ48_05310 [Candidatus Woesearchaeota archaeon]